MGRARNTQANAEAEEKLETVNAEEIANTGDEAVDALLSEGLEVEVEGSMIYEN